MLDVDDIVQEVWVRLMLKCGQIRDPMTLIVWLRIVTQRLAAQLGHRDAWMEPTPMPHDRPCTSNTEADALARHRRDEAVRGVRIALRRLRARDQELLLLLHRDDRPGYDEISRAVGRPWAASAPAAGDCSSACAATLTSLGSPTSRPPAEHAGGGW